jgi:hypothetical protein
MRPSQGTRLLRDVALERFAGDFAHRSALCLGLLLGHRALARTDRALAGFAGESVT